MRSITLTNSLATSRNPSKARGQRSGFRLTSAAMLGIEAGRQFALVQSHLGHDKPFFQAPTRFQKGRGTDEAR